jgi:uncharacterized protein (UPF0332 family)
MTESNFREIIATGWIEKADESFAEANVLLDAGMPVGCVNRLYYAVFYAVSAACAKDGRTYGKHSAVRASLHRDYVNSGVIPKHFSDIYDELFEDRQQGDYKPGTKFNIDELKRLQKETFAFIECFKKLLSEPQKIT